MQDLGLRFTGCGAAALTAALSKTASKRLMAASGIPTPPWWEMGDDVPASTRVIVKSDSEHASLGIDAGSVVMGVQARAEITAREARFGGRFFAEAYVAGREFNVALLQDAQDAQGVRVLPIPEILFDALPEGQPKIVDYAAKWDADSHAYHNTPRRFGLETQDPALAADLARHALACWHAFGLTGYARIDFRVTESGQPLVLEVNTNPCLARDAGFVATALHAGIEYHALIAHVLDAACLSPAKAA
jgi:D-alanine-D-alanine ligase